jgi:hypothetical protein
VRHPALLPTLLLSLACAGATGTPSSGTSTQMTRGSANVINSAEIEAAPQDAQTAYDIVARLRPMMMRPRNQTAGASNGEFGVMVFVEDVRLGEVDQLRTVMRATIQEIRYINATDATTRWGTGYSNGVILVRLKR